MTTVADRLGVPVAVGLYTESPAPATYFATTPSADLFDAFAYNTSGVEIREVQLAAFVIGNYSTVRD